MACAKQQPKRHVPSNHRIQVTVDLLKRGQFEQAEARLNLLRRTLRKNAKVMVLHGHALQYLERFDEAIIAYQSALDTGMKSHELLFNLAHCLNHQTRPDDAIPLVEQILRDKPNDINALKVKGLAHWLRGESVNARDCYRRALSIRPDDAQLYKAIAHLEIFTPDSPVFEVLEQYLRDESLEAAKRANALATLGKACLDIGSDSQAFSYYEQANQVMDQSLPPIHAELERLLTFTRHHFTSTLFTHLSPFGIQSRPQIIVAGMSRSGKSLVESLFRGVAGISLAGEELILSEHKNSVLTAYQGRIAPWLTDQTPETIRHDAAAYMQRLGDDGTIKLTTVPGDLWSLGFVGLWLPRVPIIFCVRNMLDLGATGYFQQYQNPEAYRYSYEQKQLGRQIAISEKVMEHWAQVLPNPVYLVDYEALVRDPQAVMKNLLGDLGLQRTQSYDEIVGANAELVDGISPIVSADAPMPITDRFIGFGDRFRDRLAPMMQGYREIVDAFPRMETPAALPQPLPERLFNFDDEGTPPSETTNFNWELPGQLTVLDNGGQLLHAANAAELMGMGTFGLVAFDPAGEIKLTSDMQKNPNLQYIPQALLGNGQGGTVYACLDPACTSTLEPLPQEQLPQKLQQSATILAKLPVGTHALDSIDGLDSVDWLLLDERHDTLSILEHGERVLADALLIQAGVAFQLVYRHQPSLAELCHWAVRHGFRFHTLVGLHYGQSMPRRPDLLVQPQASELLRADALFVPDQARMATLSDGQRLKLAFVLDTVYNMHDLSYDVLRHVGDTLAENYLKTRGFFDRKRNGPNSAELTAVRRALQAGELATQAQLLRAWATRYPHDPQVRRLHAELASWSGNDSGAIHHLNEAMKIAPDDLGMRLTGIEILLRAGMWWEADAAQQALHERFPEHSEMQRLGWEALAAQPRPDPLKVKNALQSLADLVPTSTTAQSAKQTTVQARLFAHAGQHDQAIRLHDAAITMLESAHGPSYAELLMAKADSLYQAGSIDESCEILWQSCATHPFSPYTVRAYRKLTQRLSQCRRSDLLSLASLHQAIQKIWAGYKDENLKASFGDFGLPYQGFEPLKLPGSRPAMHRLGVYTLESDLPANARALDIGCNHGFLLMGLAQHLGYGVGFDISQSCVDIGNAVAEHLGHRHIHLSSKPFDQFVCKKPFDLVIACAVHHWIGVPLPQFGAKLFSYCKPGGIVLLESQGVRRTDKTETDFDTKAATIASAGFDVVRKGSLCDDGINYREFWILRKKENKGRSS